MLNDVHPPPLEPPDPNPHHRPAQGRHPVRADRAHSLERTAGHGMGTNLVYDEPEDRGASFNTTMSAVVVGVVLVVVILITWTLW